ncbi:MAG: 3-hydroxybutyryl-CoA dehydrogenase [Lachnospiraceae bacterium]|nr:3-hydroxybutyryl-CoA dehydrogenase [Lachnospiraceae bacterium]
MKIAVIGTGTLGPSIAQVFSQCDSIDEVCICKGRTSSLSNGKDKIEKTFERLISRGKLSNDQAELYLSKIKVGEIESSAGSDLLIEAVAESLEVKKEIFKQLNSICGTETVFTTNTSSLPIQLISEGLTRPLVGMHFFNPAPIMNLVEVITTEKTPQDLVKYVMDIARMIGKTPVLVQEAPGFVVNRVLIPMINEAISIYAEGIASAEDIDIAMKLGANFPMGPLALGDMIGLDVVLAILTVMLKETGDNRYLPQPLLKRMVREKKLGRKTGEGFYVYNK